MHPDLIIIGGGILGTFHAYHALNRGLKVQLFEKDLKPAGATTQNFGQVVPSGMNHTWQQYGRRSLEIYKDLASKTDLSIRPNGSVYFASDDEELQLLEELATLNEQNQYPSQLLSAKECLSRYPGLRADYCKGGLFFPEEITAESRQMIHEVLAFLVEQKGLDYRPNTLIQEAVVKNGSCSVTTNRGEEFQADKILICSGSEFKALFPEVFAESDLEVSRLHMMQTLPQPQLRFAGNILTGLTIRRYEAFEECPSFAQIKAKEDPNAFWKKWGIHILFKQAPDGSVIIGDSHEYADAARADELGYDLYPEVREYMLQEAAKIFDLETWQLSREWYGVYSQCKTQEIFRHTIDGDIHILTGIGGKGMTGSPGFSEEHLGVIWG